MSLLELKPPRINFLLPHVTWDEVPSRLCGMSTAYADWLIATFGRWQAAGRCLAVRLDHLDFGRPGAARPRRSRLGPTACWSSRPTAATNRLIR